MMCEFVGMWSVKKNVKKLQKNLEKAESLTYLCSAIEKLSWEMTSNLSARSAQPVLSAKEKWIIENGKLKIICMYANLFVPLHDYLD